MNFRFKCIKDKGVDHPSHFTTGKVYEAKDGRVTGDCGYKFTSWSKTDSTFENLQNWFKSYYLFELVEPKSDVSDDPVNHPSHYNNGKIEVADFIADQKLNFDRGNAVKYVCRAGSKDPEKEIQDLEKAVWYINHEIKMLKGECENA